MFEEFLNSTKGQLKDRLTSPLMGSFIVSWLLINYKFILVLLSSGTYKSKLKYIDLTLYPDVTSTVIHGLALPLILSAFYIFVYPIPAQKVYQFHKRNQVKLKLLKDEIDGETLLTKNESMTLITKMIRVENESKSEVADLNSEINRLRDIIALKNNGELQAASNDINSMGNGYNNSESKRKYEIPEKTFSPNDLNEYHLRIIESLGQEGIQDTDQLSASNGCSIIMIENFLSDLMSIDYAQLYSSPNYYNLTAHGNRFFVKNFDFIAEPVKT